MKTEKQLQAYVARKAKELGAVVHKLESRSRRGFPDLGIFYAGQCTLVEVKTPAGTGRMSALQIHERRRLNEVGFKVHVIDTVKDADKLIARLDAL